MTVTEDYFETEKTPAPKAKPSVMTTWFFTDESASPVPQRQDYVAFVAAIGGWKFAAKPESRTARLRQRSKARGKRDGSTYHGEHARDTNDDADVMWGPQAQAIAGES